MSATQALTSRIEAALTVPLSQLGLDLEAVEVSAAGKRSVVRVAVDQDGGVTMDDVAEATRLVSEILDTDLSVAMGQRAYTLEVTSRGVDRPLTLPRHWRRNLTRLVKITLGDGSSLTGRVLSHDEEPDGAVVVEVSGDEHVVAYADVTRALVQIEFNRKTAGPVDDESTDEDDGDDVLDEHEGDDD